VASTTEKGSAGSGSPHTTSNNGIYVLIGLKNMGFKVGVTESLKTSSKFQPVGSYISSLTTNADGSSSSDKFEDLSYKSGYLVPSLYWGMSLPVGSMTLTPAVHALVNFGSGDSTSWTRTQLANDQLGRVTTDKVTEYKNDTSYIEPSFKYTKNVTDNFSLKAKVALGFGISSYENEPSYSQTLTTRYENPAGGSYTETKTTEGSTDNSESANTFTLTPKVQFGAQYKAIPDKLTLNAGVSVTPVSYSTTTKKTSPDEQVVRTTGTYDDGRVYTPTVTYTPATGWQDKTTVSEAIGGAVVGLGAGFTFNFTPGFAADLSFSITGFDIELSSVSVLFSLKDLSSFGKSGANSTPE